MDHDMMTGTMTIKATCGHMVTFRVTPDKPMEQRIAKHRDRKCGPCRIAENDARVAAGLTGPTKIRKGQEPKHLPVGTVIILKLQEGMTWDGILSVHDTTVKAQGAGLMGMTSKLAKAWLKEKGFQVKK